jgi:hypothetical protein
MHPSESSQPMPPHDERVQTRICLRLIRTGSFSATGKRRQACTTAMGLITMVWLDPITAAADKTCFTKFDSFLVLLPYPGTWLPRV